MNKHELERLVASIREEPIEEHVVEEAAARVRAALAGPVQAAPSHLRSCADFQALIAGYREGTLAEARRLLVEDHLHSCVACRKAFQGAPAPVVIAMKPRRAVLPWALAAAAAVAAFVLLPPVLDKALAPSGARATIASVDGALYRVTGRGTGALSPGAQIGEREEVRTAKGSRAVVRLRDGSLVEMNERSELSVSGRWSGATVHLERGNIIVQAARQHRRTLQVATLDCRVSVKGTIFAVSRGTKGSRVSVVEGQVKVEQQGETRLLARGDQTATDASLAKVPVEQDISWSKDAGRYLALLGELSAIQKKLEQAPGPGLRYAPKLTQYLPENTVVYAAIPNLASTLAEANRLFEERVRESEVLREWWNERESQKVRLMMDRVRAFGEYLGDEIVLAAPIGARGGLGEPVMLAEAKRPELRSFLEQQFAAMRLGGDAGAPLVVDNPMATFGPGKSRPMVMIRNNVVALAGDAKVLAQVSAAIDGQTAGGFTRTPFYNRVAQAYQSGAGWIFSADLEQILARSVPDRDKPVKLVSGLSDVKYLVIERKDNGGRTENRAALTFSQQRRGLASWLAAPAPMGTLDFTSPDATFAASFVIRNPRMVIEEMIQLAQSVDPKAAEGIAEFERTTGLSILNDIAGPLGGELTLSLDGPLLPTPSWKLVVEVYDPSRLEFAIERLVETINRESQGKAHLQLTKEQVGSRMFYLLRSDQSPLEMHYTFADGYLLAASNRTLLTTAMQNRETGYTLARSAAFRAQLPTDGNLNFSALVYYNLAAAVGPLADQLKATGALTDQQKQSLDLLTANREPSLIYAYGEPDRIVVASRGSFFGLNLDTLVGVSGNGAMALPQLLGPALLMRGIAAPRGQRQ